jgi:hypothetical protein
MNKKYDNNNIIIASRAYFLQLGRQFTWANNLPEPTYEKLDRVLITAEWDQAFPLAVVT